MPNIAVLSDEDSEMIRNWVKAGGKLIATFQTSLFSESGQQRSNFGLYDLFGVNYSGSIVHTETDCYQKIIARDPIMEGFDKTLLLHNGGRTIMVNPGPGTTILTGYLPKINNQPPENAFPENWDSSNPIVVRKDFGNGQVVYFSNEACKLNYTIGHPDYRNLMVNSINTLLENHEILRTNAPASVHVHLNRSDVDEEVYQLSLVNTSSSTLRPLRDLVPVSGIEVYLPFDVKYYEPLIETETETEIKTNKNILYINDLGEFCSIKLLK
jgi:hypothetical protein